MGENEGHKAVVLGRLHQVERAVKDLKAVVGKVCTAQQREPLDGCTLCIAHGCTLCIFHQNLKFSLSYTVTLFKRTENGVI